MICKCCNRQIDDDSIFCIYCKNPTDRCLDESILEQGEIPMADVIENEPIISEKKEKPQKKKNRKKRIYTLISLLIIVVMLCIFMYTNSYSYLYKKANDAKLSESYESALKYYLQALNKSQKPEAMVGLGEVYHFLDRNDESSEYYLKALETDSSNVDAFRGLLALYIENGDNAGIESLEKYAKEPEMINLLENEINNRPIFSMQGGSYNDDISVEITINTKASVYYTIDGSDPRGDNAILYESPIELTEGETVVRAVKKDENGYGIETSESYDIEYVNPPYPDVVPSGGTYASATNITITSSVEDAKIYYTWDKTPPTESSAQYTAPIPMKDGNNVLSVVVIDKHGKSSEILQCNYTYYPSTPTNE